MKSRFVLLLFALLLPALAFPIITLPLMLHDAVWGEQISVYQYAFESKRGLVYAFLGDWAEALPVLYVLHLAILWPVFAFVATRWPRNLWLPPLIGVAIGLIASFYIGGSLSAPTSVALAASGAVVAGVFGWIVIGLHRKRGFGS